MKNQKNWGWFLDRMFCLVLSIYIFQKRLNVCFDSYVGCIFWFRWNTNIFVNIHWSKPNLEKILGMLHTVDSYVGYNEIIGCNDKDLSQFPLLESIINGCTSRGLQKHVKGINKWLLKRSHIRFPYTGLCNARECAFLILFSIRVHSLLTWP